MSDKRRTQSGGDDRRRQAFRVLEALEDARLAIRDTDLSPGLQDELATVIRMIHGRLGQ